jgi:hypothetical protein
MESVSCEAHSHPPDLGPDDLTVPGLTWTSGVDPVAPTTK